jgi:hypothetical protein
MTLPWRGARELHLIASYLLTQFRHPAFEERRLRGSERQIASRNDILPGSCRRYSGVRYVPNSGTVATALSPLFPRHETSAATAAGLSCAKSRHPLPSLRVWVQAALMFCAGPLDHSAASASIER